MKEWIKPIITEYEIARTMSGDKDFKENDVGSGAGPQHGPVNPLDPTTPRS